MKKPVPKTKLRDFYVRKFPTDSLGERINPEATFEGLMKCFDNRTDVYDYIGVGDSVVRERLFSGLAEVAGITYGTIYDYWMNGV